jgi:hypothetical protein
VVKAQSIWWIICSLLSIGVCSCAGQTAVSQASVGGYVEEPVPARPHNFATVILSGKLTVLEVGGRLTLNGEDGSANNLSISCSGSGGRLKKNDRIIIISLVCSFARTGRAILTFDEGEEISGFGSLSLSDGSGGTLSFGTKRLETGSTLSTMGSNK